MLSDYVEKAPVLFWVITIFLFEIAMMTRAVWANSDAYKKYTSWKEFVRSRRFRFDVIIIIVTTIVLVISVIIYYVS